MTSAAVRFRSLNSRTAYSRARFSRTLFSCASNPPESAEAADEDEDERASKRLLPLAIVFFSEGEEAAEELEEEEGEEAAEELEEYDENKLAGT